MVVVPGFDGAHALVAFDEPGGRPLHRERGLVHAALRPRRACRIASPAPLPLGLSLRERKAGLLQVRQVGRLRSLLKPLLEIVPERAIVHESAISFASAARYAARAGFSPAASSVRSGGGIGSPNRGGGDGSIRSLLVVSDFEQAAQISGSKTAIVQILRIVLHLLLVGRCGVDGRSLAPAAFSAFSAFVLGVLLRLDDARVQRRLLVERMRGAGSRRRRSRSPPRSRSRQPPRWSRACRGYRGIATTPATILSATTIQCRASWSQNILASQADFALGLSAQREASYLGRRRGCRAASRRTRLVDCRR